MPIPAWGEASLGRRGLAQKVVSPPAAQWEIYNKNTNNRDKAQGSVSVFTV